jgi:V8-like Glu-specific endopeptidase
MASRSTTTYEEIDSEMSSPGNGSMNQPPKVQTGSEASSGEEVVDEVMGAGESAETKASGAGEETTEAEEIANHKSMSSPSFSPVFTAPAADEGGEGESGAEGAEEASEFETVPGWQESTPTETGAEGEALIEAYYSDKETSGQEFFGGLAAAFLPLVKAVLPSLAGAVVNQGVKSLRLRKLLARLSKLGISISPQKRTETGAESDEAAELDEATLSALELQLEAAEVVIGQDDRRRITTTKINPWKRICHLKIQAANGRFFLGTGFFIGPRTIVTAGHCVYMHDQGGWAKQITVTPGRDATETPFKSYTAISFRSVKGWVTDKSRNYDYGVIILPKSAAIPPEIGTFGFASYSNKVLLNKKRLNTAGYPGDRPGLGDQPLNTLWYDGRKAKAVTARTIIYDIDTAGGQSGSPVWAKLSDGKRIVVGIHTNGDQSGNSATRITKPVFENLKKWRTEGGLS